MSETTLRAFLLIVYVIGFDVGNGSLSVQIINKKNVWNQLGFLGAAPLSSGQGGGGLEQIARLEAICLRPSDSELVSPPKENI